MVVMSKPSHHRRAGCCANCEISSQEGWLGKESQGGREDRDTDEKRDVDTKGGRLRWRMDYCDGGCGGTR
ncbi:hypothetical protein L484_024546 [Morus notabilis]|uniref:Uncharacterized protein n=1 Tax=Morus notabilis TaxID=981085 RepID=W9RI35_9ROSA|nr:hypothetical protein L484_024546 [Morus notabilis]